MKQSYLEFLARRMREDHRHHPWSLSKGGLYIPYSHEDMKPDDLSHWDDVGFILNGRRYMVWWQHPRRVYAEAIEEMAWAQQRAACGDPPDRAWLTQGVTTIYKNVGRFGGRKKPIGVRTRPQSQDQVQYHAQLTEREKCLRQRGIEFEVHPSWKWKRYLRCMGMDLVAPIEVRSEQELDQLADLARQLVKRQTTLTERFGSVAYGKADWLREVGGSAS